MRPAPRVTLSCKTCSKQYERLSCQLTRGRGLYCSKVCGGIGHRNSTYLQCALCDTTFRRAIAEQDIGEKVRQFCTRDCYMEWRAMNMKGSTYPKDGARHLHRVTAERWIGRGLTAAEVVHHIDEDRHNCDPSNLALFPDQSHHMRCHYGRLDVEPFRLVSLPRAGE